MGGNQARSLAGVSVLVRSFICLRKVIPAPWRADRSGQDTASVNRLFNHPHLLPHREIELI